MYLIVSASLNYKGKIEFPGDLINANTVGHEIHITRPILMILLSNNLINTNDVIVTRNSERFFLYSNIFSNVIGYDDIPSDISDNEIVDLTLANMVFHEMNHMMSKTDLEIRFPIMTQIREHKNVYFRNEIYNSLINNIHYKDCSNIIKNDYIIIHHRITSYYAKSNYLPNIIPVIKSADPNIQIFIFCIEKLEGYSDDIIFINDISIYASLMNNEKCKAIITEFSGAGQLSQYCHNNKIFYYCKTYHFYPWLNPKDVITEANSPSNLYDKFDMKLFTNPSIYIFSNIDLLLQNFNKYYFDNNKTILRI